MIVNLRGCSGAGKSYPGFQFLSEFGPPIDEFYSTDYFPNAKTGKPRKKPKLLCQVLPGGLCLAGRYTMKRSTRTGGVGYSGGVDGFYPMDELQRLIEDLCGKYEHVLFESLLISGTFQRWLDFSELHGGRENFVFATLDTPLQTCLDRVQQRNGGRAVKEDQIDRHRKQVHRCALKFHEAGARSLMIDHTTSYEQVKQLFLTGGWDPSGSVA
jgi:hypothetical protein